MSEAAINLRISTNRDELDLALIHDFLSRDAYWSRGIAREIVQRAIENSLCFGGYLDGRQVAFARVVSDYATFAYLADVFVLESCRGRGYARQIVSAVMDEPRLQGLRRIMLMTRDAHPLYAGFGFTSLAKPDNAMEINRPDIYATAGAA
jgi:GNAT superfamily N-acetyltransferase